MKIKTSNLAFVMTPIVFLIVVIGCTIPPGTDNVKISTSFIDCNPSGFPLHVAVENGYFAEENIDVNVAQNIIHGKNGVEIPADADVIMLGRSPFYQSEAIHPNSFKAFNFNVQDKTKWNDAILVKKDSDITSLNQLIGKTIGITTGIRANNYDLPHSSRIQGVIMMLKKNGLDPEDFKIVRADEHDFENNNIDALEIREPGLSMLLDSGAYRVLVGGPIFAENIFTPWPMSISAISSEFLKENPKDAKKIVQIWDKAIDFIGENPDEADKILQRCMEKNYGLKDIKIRQINYWKNDELDKDLIQKQLDFYHTLEIVKVQLKVDDIVLQTS